MKNETPPEVWALTLEIARNTPNQIIADHRQRTYIRNLAEHHTKKAASLQNHALENQKYGENGPGSFPTKAMWAELVGDQLGESYRHALLAQDLFDLLEVEEGK